MNLTNKKSIYLLLLSFAALPLIELYLPFKLSLSDSLLPVFIFAILALGLNVVTGLAGLLHLGIAGFMAIGAYSFAILSCDIYPFRFGFWGAVISAVLIGGLSGLMLGLPTIRLAGDYLAIVTLGFAEIIQDLLKNLESITKGTQGINPLPAPEIFNLKFGPEHPLAWYYLLLGFFALCLFLVQNLVSSKLGRSWRAINGDQIAAQTLGINLIRTKLTAFSIAAALAALAGALWASYLGSSGEPSNFDFQVSIIALCIIIVAGIGNMNSILIGALLVFGLNSIVLNRLALFLSSQGFSSTATVYSSPNNWKYMIYGLALLIMMRVRPEGLFPAKDSLK